MNTQPIWEETHDDNDNSVWEAGSPVGAEEGSPFYWRVKPVLQDNRIQWKFDHDEDIRGLTADLDNDELWDSLEAAKQAVGEVHADLLKSFAEGQY